MNAPDACALRKRDGGGSSSATAAVLPSPVRAVRLERETGFEPATPTLARSCSTPELFPLDAEDSNRGPSDGQRARAPELAPSGGGAARRRNRAASSGGVGLMKKPVPSSNPARWVSFGITSRCQWKCSGSPALIGAVCSAKL
jgi:hypothetical protein